MEAPEGPPGAEKLSRDEPAKFMPEIINYMLCETSKT